MSADLTIHNINGICRLCLKDDGTIIPIFGRENVNRDCIPLSRKILACVSVEVLDKDTLPKMICVGCVHQIDSWHGFKTICDKSQEKLNTWLDKECSRIDQQSPDVIIEECTDPNSEIVILDSDDEMEVDSIETLHDITEPHKGQMSVEPVDIIDDESTLVDEDGENITRPNDENKTDFSETENLRISATCSLSDKDVNENGDVLHSEDLDSPHALEETNGGSGILSLESVKIAVCVDGKVQLNDSDKSENVENIKESDRILLPNGLGEDDGNIDSEHVKTAEENINVGTDLGAESEEKEAEQNDADLSETEIIASIVESLAKSIAKAIDGEHHDESICTGNDQTEDKVAEVLDTSKETNPDAESACNNTKFVIQAVTSLAEQEGATRDSVQSETEMDVEKDKPPDSGWQDDSQGSKQPQQNEPDLIVLESRFTANNGPYTDISGFHIKEEPMSDDEEVMVDEDPLISVSIKKEPGDSVEPEPDVKPNIYKLNVAVDISKYVPEIRKNGKVFCDPCRATFPNRHKYLRHSESNRHLVNTECYLTGEDPILIKQRKFLGLNPRYKLRKPVGAVGVKLKPVVTARDGAFPCTLCPSSFTLKRNYLHHIKLKHYEVYVNGAHESNIDEVDLDLFNLNCTKCDNKFPSTKSLKLHFALKHRNHDNVCGNCNQEFPQRNALLSHMRYCRLKSTSHTCFRCSGVFTSTESFLAHKQNCRLPRQTENHQQKQLLACTLCSESFQTTDALITHVRSNHSVHDEPKEKPIVHENRPRPVIENKPRPIYESKPKPVYENKPKPMQQNQQQTFSEDGILYCKYCTRTFSNHGALSSHLGYHTRKSSFECKLCPTITKTMKSFKQHMRKHLAERTECYMCWICYTPFTTAEKLRKHKAVHIKLKIYSCNRCDNSYNSLISLTKHKKKIHGVDDIPIEEPAPVKESPVHEPIYEDSLVNDLNELPECKICKKKFSTIGNLKRHAVLHVKVKKPIYPSALPVFSAAGHYRCSNCSKMCGSLAGLRTHYKYCILRGKNLPFKQRSLQPKQSVRCDKCKQYFASKACLYKHKYLKRCPLVDRTKTSSFSCMNCRKLFTTLASLQRHLMHCGDGVDRDTSCQYCGLKFSSFIVLSGHMQQCVQNMQNNLCSICDEHFDSAEDLRVHTQTCLPERIPSPNIRGALATCTICNKEFRYSKSLESHIFKNHSEILVDCTTCLRKFVSQTALNDHQLVCTTEQTPDNEEPQPKNTSQNSYDARVSHTLCYKCSTCGDVFNSLDDLEIHSFDCENDSSKDAEPKARIGYNCRNCGKRFSSRSSLYRHKMEKHTASAPQTPSETPPQPSVEEPQPPFLCSACPDISFHKHKGFLEHMEWHKQENIKKETPKPHREEGRPMLTCELCDEQFTNESLYQDHMEEHLSNDVESSYAETPTSSKQSTDLVHCDICNKGFDNKQSLKSHRACHFRVKYSPVGSPMKDFVDPSMKKYKVKHVRCNVCDKLLSKNSIAKHRLIHLREDSYDFSAKQTPVTSGFIAQERTVQDDPTGEENSPVTLSESQTVFPCTLCNKLFRLRKSLHEHMKLHEEESELDDAAKPEDFDDDGASTSSLYECKYCDITWKHKTNYIRHLSTRTHHEMEVRLAAII